MKQPKVRNPKEIGEDSFTFNEEETALIYESLGEHPDVELVQRVARGQHMVRLMYDIDMLRKQNENKK